MDEQKSVFDTLFSVNVNGHTEKKKSGKTELTYLSWPFAWAEVKKAYPSATYEVVKQANGLPYVFDQNTGYMVNTRVTIDGITHEMWLPVMDGANRAMKAERYQYTTQFGSKTVEAATMFDVNKAIMRCLVKNLAMFGLGLYIYAGEDLPEIEQPEPAQPVTPDSPEVSLSVEKDMCNTAMKGYALKYGADLTKDVYPKVRGKIGKKFSQFTASDWKAAREYVEGGMQ